VNETHDSEADAGEQHFVPMLVHELRTPLTALLGSLGLLAGAVDEATPEVRSFAAIANRNADRLASTLDDVAEYYRLNDPATRPNLERTDLGDTGQRAVEQVQALIDERGILLDIHTTSVEARVDPSLVRIAVVRLLSYAVRTSPRKATVRVRVEVVDAERREPGAEKHDPSGATVVVSVSDAGRVVSAERAARIFDPFSAVAGRGSEPAVLKGLGLAIAMRIARLHGGSLAFTSTEQGGLFELRLPG
jgi:signal transduction histidine kinase